MDRPAQPDRYQPLPSLTQLPRFLVRKMSHRAKELAIAGLVLLAIAIAIGIPLLVSAKDRSDAAAARASARADAARIAQLRAEIRRVDGRGTASRGLHGTSAVAARQALVGDLASAITADAARRLKAGDFAEPVKSVQCSRFPAATGLQDPAANLSLPRARYACLAVTATFARGAGSVGGSIGYPYRAVVHFGSGAFTFCKISGRPGEQSITKSIPVPIPPACGGDR
jgi:hypothetical protein